MIELNDALIIFNGPRGRGINAADPHLGLPRHRVFPALWHMHQQSNRNLHDMLKMISNENCL